MSNDNKKTALPKLRFPEFQESPEWVEAPIEELFDLEEKSEKGGVFDKEKIITVRLHGLGVVKNDRAAALTGGTNYFKRNTGQFIFSKIDLLNGAFGLVPKELDGFVSSSDIPALTFKNQKSAKFFLNWMLANYKDLVLERTGTSSTLKRISKKGFLDATIWLPALPEQQKIAVTLSSLDDLLTAQSAKLEALNAHKRGLMQGLFPAEGETVPKLRFPEFQEAEEWEEKQLGTLCSNIASGKDKSDSSGIYNLFGSTGIIGKTNVDSHNGDFILVARVGANAGFLNRASGQFGVTDNTLVISLKDSENTDFVYRTLEQYGLNKLMFGSGQPLITGGQLKSLILCRPKPAEQQKIADCLSSLDNHITAQSQKIEALKLHKKGLMHNLFPALKNIQ